MCVCVWGRSSSTYKRYIYIYIFIYRCVCGGGGGVVRIRYIYIYIYIYIQTRIHVCIIHSETDKQTKLFTSLFCTTLSVQEMDIFL